VQKNSKIKSPVSCAMRSQNDECWMAVAVNSRIAVSSKPSQTLDSAPTPTLVCFAHLPNLTGNGVQTESLPQGSTPHPEWFGLRLHEGVSTCVRSEF
jgi:hypothetical protein